MKYNHLNLNLEMSKWALKEKVQCGYKMKQPEGCPDDVYSKMVECWDLDAKSRPSFQSIHEFFTKYKVSTDTKSAGWRFNQEDDFHYAGMYR